MTYHIKTKKLLLIGLIIITFCEITALTPLGARTVVIVRFQIAELLADDSYDEYCMDTERFYVRNRETIHSLKQMIFQTSCERKSTQDCESTLEGPNYYLGEQCFGGDTFCYYQFGPVRYHFVFRSADYRIWRAYIDSVRRSGGIGYGMALK